MTCKTKPALVNNKSRKQDFLTMMKPSYNILFFSNNINFKSLRNCQEQRTADMRKRTPMQVQWSLAVHSMKTQWGTKYNTVEAGAGRGSQNMDKHQFIYQAKHAEMNHKKYLPKPTFKQHLYEGG